MNSTPLSSAPTDTPENEPAGRVRPQLLTEEIAHAIYNTIRAYGLSESHAGLLAGVSTSTLARWKQEFEDFSDMLEMARAEFERNRVLALLEATRPDGTPDWRAQAWLLRHASREGGWGRAANPLKDAAPKKAEILPKNTPAPEEPAAPVPPTAPMPVAEEHPATRPDLVSTKPNSVPKIPSPSASNETCAASMPTREGARAA